MSFQKRPARVFCAYRLPAETKAAIKEIAKRQAEICGGKESDAEAIILVVDCYLQRGTPNKEPAAEKLARVEESTIARRLDRAPILKPGAKAL